MCDCIASIVDSPETKNPHTEYWNEFVPKDDSEVHGVPRRHWCTHEWMWNTPKLHGLIASESRTAERQTTFIRSTARNYDEIKLYGCWVPHQPKLIGRWTHLLAAIRNVRLTTNINVLYGTTVMDVCCSLFSDERFRANNSKYNFSVQFLHAHYHYYLLLLSSYYYYFACFN